MRVLKASSMGVCFGVRDALRFADSIPQPVDVTVYGQLVHNPLVQQRMAQRGFRQTMEGSQRNSIPDTPYVLITAHGISQWRRDQLENAGKTLLDTTCPLVKKAHNAAVTLGRQGYHVLLIGRPRHVEVQGIIEDLPSYDVVPDVAAVKSYSHPKLGIMCQTTTPAWLAEQIRHAIAKKNPHAEIKFVDTICQPTKDRQDAVEYLLGQVQAMVVVGGENSNNTRQLAQRCRDRGVTAYHVQRADELDSRWFDHMDTVGLTAGTSTLPETIEEVYQALVAMEPHGDTSVDSGASGATIARRMNPPAEVPLRVGGVVPR
jgi:4-hydroxy-3-methylbut-2-enyl diphosphate reductase